MPPSQLSVAAFDLADRGFKVVPLLPQEKRPRINQWQIAASSSEDTISDWWDKWPDSNVGVKLGSDSGIIDVECDDAEAEETLSRLFDGEIPITPTYSAARGKHRLFRWRPDLPEPLKAVFKIGKLEFRTGNGGNGAQSVFPPSIHPTGAPYRWLVSLDDAPLADFTPAALTRLWNWCGEDGVAGQEKKPPEHWEKIIGGVGEGNRNQDAASLCGMLLRNMADPYDNEAVTLQWQMVEAWNERNQPPLATKELEATFKSILNRERQRRTNDTYKAEFSKESRPAIGEQAKKPNQDGWRLEIRDTKPRSYSLYSPLWHGNVTLSSDAVLKPETIRREVLEQKDVWVPSSFCKVWNGNRETPSLGRELVETATVVKAAVEQHRDRVVASLFLEQLLDAEVLDEGAEIDPRGRPQQLPDGSVIFLFTRVWKELAFGADKVTRLELSALLESIGATNHRDAHKRRFKMIDKAAFRALEALTEERTDSDRQPTDSEKFVPPNADRKSLVEAG